MTLRRCPHHVPENVVCAICARYVQGVVGATPDGKPGPRTMFAVAAYLRARGAAGDEPPTNPGTPSAKSAAAVRASGVELALSLVGDLDPVTRVWPHVCPAFARPEFRHTKAWCGGFALLVWKSTLPGCKDWMWDPSGNPGGFVGPYGVHTVPLPEPLDIAYWRDLPGSPGISHYAIVRYAERGFVHTIDGNVLPHPREGVAERKRSIIDTRPVFYSAAAYL